MSGNHLTGCAHDDDGSVQPCVEVRVRLTDAVCAIRVGERGVAQRLRREAALIVKEHLRLEALERGEP